ncbi:MAG TPA: heme exporter protein CcmD [Rhizobiales bacterium]|nr:heme exporter protein CcmD [Hyphomicrobiales bacterium]
MDFSAKHIEFVLACYAISAVLLALMTITIVWRSKKHDRELARLEQARGKSKG